jgi:hypothetical protein
MANYKGFLQDFNGNKMLPITRAELILDAAGNVALTSALFEAGRGGSQYGLISASDLAALKIVTGGTTGGQNLGDIYTKLSAINTSLKVGDTSLPFYSVSENTVTTNNIKFVGQNGIKLYTNDSNILVELDKLTPIPASVTNQIITSITVDEYGRVTNISGTSKLDNEVLPDTIMGKDLSGCTVTTNGSSPTSLVNKEYVDQAVGGATAAASGALVFSGTLDNSTKAQNVLNDVKNNQKYYKITSDFSLSNDYVHDADSEGDTYLYSGDTLIAYKSSDVSDLKFIYIPSGNDITAVSVGTTSNENIMYKQNGSVGFIFDDALFTVTPNSNVATIAMKEVTASNPGYLSAAGYVKLQNATSVSYSSEDIGSLVLGTITIDGTAYEIKGINNVTKLSLANGTDISNAALNPRLKFEESGSPESYITFKGGPGIIVKKSESESEIAFGSVLEVAADSSEYLTLSNDKNTIGINLGAVTNWNTSTEGLVNVALLKNTIASYAVNFIEWNSTQMQYGSTELAAAVAFN